VVEAASSKYHGEKVQMDLVMALQLALALVAVVPLVEQIVEVDNQALVVLVGFILLGVN
jgi:uncharacterized membrane-anchored protein